MSKIRKDIDNLPPKKRELFELLLKEKKAKAESQPTDVITKRPDTSSYPLSFAQQRLWFINLVEPDNPAYNMSFCWRLVGPMKVGVLERAVSEVERRHEILRASFPAVDGRPSLVIAPVRPHRIALIDLKGLPEQHRETEARRLAYEEARRPFDLARGSLLRTTLLQLGNEDHIALFTMHHIISDGWSLGLFLKEVSLLYGAYLADHPSPLAELPIQYTDFACWQREQVTQGRLGEQLVYWKKQLADSPPKLSLPTICPRPGGSRSWGATKSFVLPDDLHESLKLLSLREGTTLFMTTLAAFQALLSIYSGQQDVVVGSPVANRSRAELDGLIGMMVNTLALRTDLSGNPTFSQLLKRVREVALGAYANQEMPFDKLVEELRPERIQNQTPLFQVMFHLQNTPLPSLGMAGLKRKPFSVPDPGAAMFDLTLSLMERADADEGGPVRMTGSLEYNSDLFDSITIDRMLENYQVLLRNVASNPDVRLSDLQVLSIAESQLIAEWGAARDDSPGDICYQKLFEAQSSRTPDAVAVTGVDGQLTFGELNARANQLAHYLRAIGVEPEARVAICLDRSIGMMVGLLGILKSGGAFLPLDTATPQERLTDLLKEARADYLLTSARLAGVLSAYNGKIVMIDPIDNPIEQMSRENPRSLSSGRNLAYLIFTSGSTGQPKAVMVEQANLVNHALSIKSQYALQPGDRVLQFASLSFDVAIEEIFPTWLSGAAVVLRTNEQALSSDQFLGLIENEKATVINLPASYWHQLVTELSRFSKRLPAAIRLMIVGSEKVSAERYATWLQMDTGNAILLSAYGVTEATITTTLYVPPPKADDLAGQAALPVGRPIAGANLYLTNHSHELVPVGASGELFIGGRGVSRGYLDQPGLTAQAFIPDRFSDRGGERLYRTGDLARYFPDSILDLIGRSDNQEKIRGFRIELAEIEAALSRHPSVRECIIAANENAAGQKILVGYITCEEGHALEANELRNYLRERLPDYMVPTVFVTLESIPRMANGKVDHRALPDLASRLAQLESSYVAPRTEFERKITAIWQEALGVEKVGVDDNFFDLGGHSILMAEIFTRLQKEINKDITIAELFEYPTVALLARWLSQDKTGRSSALKSKETSERFKEGRSRLRQQFRQRQQGGKGK
jgi:amino acid adenylation domain-containing protein